MRKFHIVHNKTNVERLYLPRNEGGRGLISLWKHYQKTIVNVVHYLHRNSDSRFIKLFLKWDENRGPTSLTFKARKYAEEANLPFDQLLEMEKDKCKEKTKIRHYSKRQSCCHQHAITWSVPNSSSQ